MKRTAFFCVWMLSVGCGDDGGGEPSCPLEEGSFLTGHYQASVRVVGDDCGLGPFSAVWRLESSLIDYTPDPDPINDCAGDIGFVNDSCELDAVNVVCSVSTASGGPYGFEGKLDVADDGRTFSGLVHFTGNGCDKFIELSLAPKSQTN